MTFKVGDTVRLTDNPKRWSGTIKGVLGDDLYNVFWTDADSDWVGFVNYYADRLELVTEVPSGASTQGLSDGGPSDYYNFPAGFNTLNDFIEHKSLHQWKEHSFHWGNVVKALTRWGDKDGTTKEYDAKKVIYSGCRVLKAIIGVEKLRVYLQKLLDDPQFKGGN